jgi:Phytanoyl-CoA dioxygenase (PhyH)
VLDEGQLREFGDKGYLVLPGVVPQSLLAAVDAEIDALATEKPPPAGTVGNHFYFESSGRLPACDAALRESPAIHLAEALVTPRTVDHGLDHIQVALNIPPFPHRPGAPHIDGHRPEQDRPHSFTMLAGIYLVDESAPDSGNLWVWPGSHLAHERLFREQGPTALLATSGHPSSLAAPPEYSEPVQVLANRGDLLLAHFLLGHNIGGNTSNRTRRIAYYRLSCPGHASRWAGTFTSAFTEYEPVRRALDAAKERS